MTELNPEEVEAEAARYIAEELRVEAVAIAMSDLNSHIFENLHRNRRDDYMRMARAAIAAMPPREVSATHWAIQRNGFHIGLWSDEKLAREVFTGAEGEEIIALRALTGETP